MYDILELNDKLVGELKEIARLLNIPNYDELRKQELVYKILDQQALNPNSTDAIKTTMTGKGVVEKEEAHKEVRVEREPRADKIKHEKPAEPAVAVSSDKAGIKRRRVIPDKSNNDSTPE